MIRKLISTLLVGFVCLGSYALQAQGYNWLAPLDSVNQDGFYKLILKPDVTGRMLTENYSDLRLYDQNKKAVPFLLQEEWDTDKKWFEEYTVLSKEISPERSTKLILHNPKKNSIDNFSLVVKNNSAYKLAKLSGSDDQQNWFFITDNYSLSLMQDENSVVSEKRIHFPLTNYEYYKLEVNDSASAPLNILKVGYYATSPATAKQTLLPVPIVSQSDSLQGKQTFVRFKFKNSFHIQTLTFDIDGPIFYKRKATLFKVENGGTVFTKQISLELRSDSKPFIIPGIQLYGNEFLLVIDNDDNESLSIRSVKAFQRTNYMVAYLEKGNQYFLSVGNKKAVLPSYDLASFRDSIPAVLPEVRPVRFEFIKEEKKPEAKEDWFKSKAWIWSALAVAIALLGLISYRMIKEMDRKEN